MAAFAEARRQARAIDGRAHQRLTGGAARFIEIIVGSVLGGMTVNGVAFPRQGQRGKADVARMHMVAVFVVKTLEHDLKPVAGADVALEIHIPGIGTNHFHQHRVGDTGFATGNVETGFNRPFGPGQDAVERLFDRGGREAALGVPDDNDGGIIIGFHGEAREASQSRIAGGGRAGGRRQEGDGNAVSVLDAAGIEKFA